MVNLNNYTVHISEDIINEPTIALSDNEKEASIGKTTSDYEFQLMDNNFQYNLDIYRANIQKIGNILNTTLQSTGNYSVLNFEKINKNSYDGKSPESSKKLYFIKLEDNNDS